MSEHLPCRCLGGRLKPRIAPGFGAVYEVYRAFTGEVVFAVTYVWAFLVGGFIAAAVQFVALMAPKLTPAHLLAGLTVAGAVLNGFGLYDRLITFAGAGALIPVSGFGAAITKGVLQEIEKIGWEGLFTGTFEIVGLGIAAAVLFATAAALVASPQG